MGGAATAYPGEAAGVLLYGFVPGDVEVTADARGLADPVGPVTTVRHGAIAALVSETPLDVRLGRPADLVAYQELLDGVAVDAEVPVLPVRFGTVLANRDAVAELLALRQDDYRAALDALTGRVEYVVRTRYREGPLLTEVLAENPEAADLRAQLRDQPDGTAIELRIRLGELVYRAVEARRAADNDSLVQALAPTCVASAVQPPRHEQDGPQVAFLVERRTEAAFGEAVGRLTRQWRERADVRLHGPVAPWDFVPAPTPSG